MATEHDHAAALQENARLRVENDRLKAELEATRQVKRALLWLLNLNPSLL